MAKIDLTKYGITGTTEIVYNPSYEMLFEEETKPGLEGFEKGRVSELGAVNVMTVFIPDVLLKTNTSLWMRTPKTQFGGHLMSTRTITIRQHRKHGMQLKICQEGALQQETFRSRCILRS